MAAVVCTQCGLQNIAERKTCKNCGTQLDDTKQPVFSTKAFAPAAENSQSYPFPSTQSSGLAAATLPRAQRPASEEYMMVQMPRTFKFQSHQGNEAAIFLQDLVNQYADQGWQFYRVDELGVVSSPGCLASLLGAKEVVIPYYIVTFKRSKGGSV